MVRQDSLSKVTNRRGSKKKGSSKNKTLTGQRKRVDRPLLISWITKDDGQESWRDLVTFHELSQNPLRTVRAPLRTVRAPLQTVTAPLRAVKAPLRTVTAHLRTVTAPLRIVTAPTKNCHSAPTNCHSALTNCHSALETKVMGQRGEHEHKVFYYSLALVVLRGESRQLLRSTYMMVYSGECLLAAIGRCLSTESIALAGMKKSLTLRSSRSRFYGGGCTANVIQRRKSGQIPRCARPSASTL